LYDLALLEAVLGDYHRNIPAARDAEVLHVMATIVNRVGQYIIDSVPAMLEAIFTPTLEMINKVRSPFAHESSLVG
jgi:exportin-1